MDAVEIYKHFSLEEDRKKIEAGEYTGVDFKTAEVEKISELTADLMGFGTEESQRIVIEYDKNYPYFIVKRMLMNYGASENAP